MNNKLPLEELSINQVYMEGQQDIVYKVPIYQRNYAWDDAQISALVKDIFDSYEKDKNSFYYIGTLVTFKRNDNPISETYEVIDGQQRLTTVYLILKALDFGEKDIINKLTYSARQVSKDTLAALPKCIEVNDLGITNGFKFAKNAIKEIVGSSVNEFKNYFLHNVKLIHYQVPKDVDLNHYFEVMNSRGEQLEKHEIVKARLLSTLDNENDKQTFSTVWDACSDMNCYIQQKYKNEKLFCDNTITGFCIFDSNSSECETSINNLTIKDLINAGVSKQNSNSNIVEVDSFQAIIDFPNFLLIVLKLTRILREENFNPKEFVLDDKELINEFSKIKVEKKFAKVFICTLLRAKYFLDNYIVHHANSDKENLGDNPWELEYYFTEGNNHYLKNFLDDKSKQDELVHLLSMMEVTFSAKQRKNYLLYCLLYLITNDYKNKNAYCDFVRSLSHKMFYDIYLDKNQLNENNTPRPDAFDSVILDGKKINLEIKNIKPDFNSVYKKGSANISLFVFNFTDYKIWQKYLKELRGQNTKKSDLIRTKFFDDLGCSDFELKIFDEFYFSRTRKSLEHYFPRAKVGLDNDYTQEDINCFGNFAMISANANSTGSNWEPKQKLGFYSDSKADSVGVSSLKFKIMMTMCRDNDEKMLNETITREKGFEWNKEDMNSHQEKMIKILDCYQ